LRRAAPHAAPQPRASGAVAGLDPALGRAARGADEHAYRPRPRQAAGRNARECGPRPRPHGDRVVSVLFTVVLPVFLILGYGYVVTWRGMLSDSAIDGIQRFAQNFALPVLLFQSMAAMDMGGDLDAGKIV